MNYFPLLLVLIGVLVFFGARYLYRRFVQRRSGRYDRCPHCGRYYERGNYYCPHCGEVVGDREDERRSP
ncbi:MAG: hypothetical protein ACOC88_01725 [Candidatus Bipolaricaulota bacterium]